MVSKVVFAGGVPHTPVFPEAAAAGRGDVADRYDRVRAALEQARPTAVVVVTCDHINSFFLDNWPTFAIVVAKEVTGPNDIVPGLSPRPYPVASALADHLLRGLVGQDFDLSVSMERSVDHSVVVPLHFLNRRELPMVPLYVNGMVPPLPSGRRCHGMGRALRAAIEAFPGDERVAVLASGSFSLEVGGPRVAAGHTWSVPRPDWAATVADRLRTGDTGTLLAESSPSMLSEAGTVGGELLPWLTVAATAEHLTAPIVDHRDGEGHAFVTWAEEGV